MGHLKLGAGSVPILMTHIKLVKCACWGTFFCVTSSYVGSWYHIEVKWCSESVCDDNHISTILTKVKVKLSLCTT